jgi:SOS regulatory protein LexA
MHKDFYVNRLTRERSYTYDGGRSSPLPLMPSELTPHQRTVLSYIREFQTKRGYSPSLADLAIAFGVRSKNAVAKVVNVLTKAKHLEKDPKGRIKILEHEGEEFQPMTLPLFGPIAAGFAAPVEEQAEDTVTLEDYLVRDKASTFLLRVKGDSMINAGINEGDMVIVERGTHPRPNDIVVGIIDGEFTLKRLRREKGKYYLQAENPAYPDFYALDELQVAGVVKGLIRKY